MSKLDICNNALLKIGEQILVSLDDGNSDALLCNSLFDQAIEEVLREYTWGCAKTRVRLAKLTETPPFGYDYYYSLPSDFIRLVNIYDNAGNWDPSNNWIIESDRILSDIDGVCLTYIRKVTDTKILDSLCIGAIINKLATKMAFAKTASRTLVQSLIEEYETVILPRARSIDTYENKDVMESQLDPWLNSRDGSLGGTRINI